MKKGWHFPKYSISSKLVASLYQRKLFNEMLLFWVHPFLPTAQASDLGGSTQPTSFTSIYSRWMPGTQTMVPRGLSNHFPWKSAAR